MCSFSSLIRSALFLSPLPQGKRGKANPFSRSVSSRVLPSYEASKGEAAESSSCTKRLFSTRFQQTKGKRSAERRIVLPIAAISAAARCLPTTRPPFGAHACGTRHRLLPRWLSSRTGFPAAAADGCFTRFANPKKKEQCHG